MNLGFVLLHDGTKLPREVAVTRTLKEVHTNVGLPLELKLQAQEVALGRARATGDAPPSFKRLVAEALEALIAREAKP